MYWGRFKAGGVHGIECIYLANSLLALGFGPYFSTDSNITFILCISDPIVWSLFHLCGNCLNRYEEMAVGQHPKICDVRWLTFELTFQRD